MSREKYENGLCTYKTTYATCYSRATMRCSYCDVRRCDTHCGKDGWPNRPLGAAVHFCDGQATDGARVGTFLPLTPAGARTPGLSMAEAREMAKRMAEPCQFMSIDIETPVMPVQDGELEGLLSQKAAYYLQQYSYNKWPFKETRGGEKEMNIDTLKTFKAAALGVEDLVELETYADALVQGFKRNDVSAPDWLVEKQQELQSAIKSRQRDTWEKELKDTERALDQLKTAEEKRVEKNARAAELRAKLGKQ